MLKDYYKTRSDPLKWNIGDKKNGMRNGNSL